MIVSLVKIYKQYNAIGTDIMKYYGIYMIYFYQCKIVYVKFCLYTI